MNVKRLLVLVLAILMLAACASAEEFVPAAAAAEWKAEDFNGTWRVFYVISDGVGGDTRESVFQRTLAIDGESAVNTFNNGENEFITDCTIDYTGEKVILTYADGNTAEITLLEDGTMQLYLAATDITVETYMYYEKDAQ